ncbi:MAG: putative quinol monooxygenase [Pseudomonadota bacterium]
MIIIEASARIPDGAWDSAKSAMEAMILASREEEGCIEYAYSLDILDTSVMRIIERWKDMDALKFHFATPHMATFRAALAELAPSDLSIRMYDAEPQALPL